VTSVLIAILSALAALGGVALWAHLEPRRHAPPPATHDLTGTDYAFRPRDGGQRGSIAAWDDLHPRPGDYLILRDGPGTTRYQVTSTDDCPNVDPPTMWMAQLVFAPRPAAAVTAGEDT
jgi:hypothetical protein